MSTDESVPRGRADDSPAHSRRRSAGYEWETSGSLGDGRPFSHRCGSSEKIPESLQPGLFMRAPQFGGRGAASAAPDAAFMDIGFSHKGLRFAAECEFPQGLKSVCENSTTHLFS